MAESIYSFVICVVCDFNQAVFNANTEKVMCPMCGAMSDKDGAVLRILPTPYEIHETNDQTD
jgi:ribosomal protein S27E